MNIEPNELHNLLILCGADKPYLNDGRLSKKGVIAYGKLVDIIYNIKKCGLDINANRFIDQLDKMIDTNY